MHRFITPPFVAVATFTQTTLKLVVYYNISATTTIGISPMKLAAHARTSHGTRPSKIALSIITSCSRRLRKVLEEKAVKVIHCFHNYSMPPTLEGIQARPRCF
jgi:hypothetical protein